MMKDVEGFNEINVNIDWNSFFFYENTLAWKALIFCTNTVVVCYFSIISF
jgi:hypothetical protein